MHDHAIEAERRSAVGPAQRALEAHAVRRFDRDDLDRGCHLGASSTGKLMFTWMLSGSMMPIWYLSGSMRSVNFTPWAFQLARYSASPVAQNSTCMMRPVLRPF